ncbi:TCP-1/cpn60 chaperonin family protein [Candidatus Woesearchaeota archaeon]|nr:TCP-1/cpn60 chaperonin family protein [Candidatus Woesearchaeota archaeon]
MNNNRSSYQPVYILPEGSQRNTGRDAQRLNIQAAKAVGEAVRTTLGPKGMDKMLVDSSNEVTVTNDGVTILKEMNIEHPSAKMIVEIAQTQEDEVGDGTTTAVVLAGELLKRAEGLLDQEIHPTVIAKGYRLAAAKAQEVLKELAEPVTPKDTATLSKIAMTAMTGKGAENNKELLSRIAIRALRQVAVEDNGSMAVDKSDIKLEPKVGGGVEETELIEGIVLDKERVHSAMPLKVKDARIALIDSPLEVKSTEMDAKISITDPAKMQEFLDMEENMLQEMVDRVTKTGANVVCCQKGVDDLAQHFLAKKGVYVLRRVKKSDMEKLSKATGASIITDLKNLSSKDLGMAGLVEEVKVGDEGMTYIRDCRNPRSVTVLIRGGTEHVVDEVKRALEDALGDVAAALRLQFVVAGAGASEVELARHLRQYADGLSGRVQLAVRSFADAMEVVPRTLAENAGLDPIDVITDLKAAHDKDRRWAGINVFTGKVMDAWKQGVMEPLKIKTQAVSSAAEVAVMILRIDDVILSEPQGGQKSGPSGQDYPGMPEM